MWRSCRSSRTSSIRIWSPTGSTTYRSGCARRCTRASPPSSAAANATAAARLPVPGGPCRRYACAGPSASAAKRRRFASGCSGTDAKALTDRLGELGRRQRAVDRLDAVGEHARELTERVVDGAVEFGALALDPVGRRAAAAEGLGRVEEDHEGHVGEETTRRLQVQLEHALDAEAARDPLVGERRVEIAVRHDVQAGG